MSEQNNLFDPKLYERVRQPLLEAETLPPWCYTSEEFLQGEVSTIFQRMWNFAGRADEVPDPGSYLSINICGEPIFVVRDKEGGLRAFANSCRHRGARLVCGTGKKRAITCPYHGWTYDLDGTLRGAPGMEDTIGFDLADYPLVPLSVDTWAGFLFVHFSTDPPPLKDQLGNLPTVFSSYSYEDLVCVQRTTYDLACNWKIYIENAMEDYHTATVHRKSIGTQKTFREDAIGDWDAIFMPCADTIAILPGDTTPFPFISTLEGRPAEGTYFTVLYPNTFFACTQDCMWWLQALPETAGRSEIVHGVCFPKETAARNDFNEILPRYNKRWVKSLKEDNDISEEQQAGLRSSLNGPGRFCIQEPIVHALDNWVLDRVLDTKSKAA
ncbi:aromatic ring-hydroxylating dioxygenase subunit alpha [Hwanghaeella grinnelliae]|uniref:Aromatic ring-hydroxylating dioxygenase subunit alpha n=1 Tax=Hwanghaeella grinnelliae TaxID=2500179 RepID=A0A3S2WB90_9PROT|nr:aromatic ring-hydroxylating dioxygenase subunit alpha [Hwanghaeella grinnelliae]RVU38439.1 aromatic ring-hydroxylating dioxygenase subunit alpha [Hwanghaeella grinnelliae]